MDQAQVPIPADDDDVLDSYSQTVMRVAAAVTPHVAAIEMTAQRRNGRVWVGAGSAVLFTEDGYLLTNSHVVAGTRHGFAVFGDGSRMEPDVKATLMSTHQEKTGGSAEAASKWIDEMGTKNRYVLDVWAGN